MDSFIKETLLDGSSCDSWLYLLYAYECILTQNFYGPKQCPMIRKPVLKYLRPLLSRLPGPLHPLSPFLNDLCTVFFYWNKISVHKLYRQFYPIGINSF